MTDGPEPDAGWRRLGALVTGGLLILVFLGLDETQTTLRYTIVNVFTFSTPGEPYFWLAHALLLVPAAALMGYGLAPWIGPRAAALRDRLDALQRREVIAGVACIGLLGAALARISRAVFLFDRAITDDELGLRFGGQILAGGSAATVEPALFEHMPRLFTYSHDGVVASLDWPGGQLALAAAELGLGPWVHAALAAVPLVAVAVVLGRRLGRVWGLVGVLFLLLSPMAFALSMTVHAHLVSRALLSLAILGFVLGLDTERRWAWLLAGFGLAASLATRPMETFTLALPLLLYLLYRAAREPAGRAALLFTALGALLPLVGFLAYNAAVTGDPLLPARFSEHITADLHLHKGGMIPGDLSLLWNRFGSNLAYNLFMLAIWVLGPLGVLLVIVGLSRDRLTRLLAAGVGLNLLLALGHDNHGVHHVGPIHYSEAVVPLVIIAAFGLHGLRRRLSALRASFRTLGAMALAIVVIGLGLFNVWHGLHLQRQAAIHDTIYALLERDDLPRSVVLVPGYANLWRSFKRFARAGSWVLQWRRNRPDLGDNALLLHDTKGVAELAHEAYPDRKLMRLLRVPTSAGLALVPVDLSKEAGWWEAKQRAREAAQGRGRSRGKRKGNAPAPERSR